MTALSNAFGRSGMRRSYWLASTILASLLVPAGCATAIAQQSAAPATTLPTLVVSPTTLPTPVDQTASTVTVITAADLEREQRRTLPDALSAVPGLNVVQQGGAGALTSVFMRGTNPNHTKVLIDGIDVSDPSNVGRVFDYGQLLTADIERIEVLRGPQSGLYGADAIGGVISITTKKGEGPPKATAMTEFGSFGTVNSNAGISGGTAGYNYSFNVAHLRADTPVTPRELLPPGQARNNDLYDNWTYSTRLGANLNENFALNFVGRYTDAKLNFTGDDFDLTTFKAVPAAQQSIQVLHQFFTRGEAVWTLLDGRFKNYFGVNYTDHWSWNKSPDTAFGPTPATVNKGDRTKFDWRGVVSVLPGQTVVMGLEQETERLRTDTTTAENGNKAGYVELQSNFSDRFFVVSNVRFDNNDAFGDHATYRVAPAVILPGTETKLKASYGTGFKAPTLNQLYVDFPAFGFFANPNLRPEESTGYDIGFEQPFGGNRLRFGVTYFHNDITDLISFTSTSYINVNQAETSGIEAFAAVAVTDRLKLRTDYTYTKAIDTLTGLELLRRPRHKASVTAAWTPIDPLTLSATVISVGDFIDISRDGSVPRLNAPGYTLVNLSASYDIDSQIKAFARIDNLFNLHYENPTGFDRPGIGVFAGIRLATR